MAKESLTPDQATYVRRMLKDAVAASSQALVGKKVGLSQGAISKIVDGREGTSFALASRAQKALSVSIVKFLEGMGFDLTEIRDAIRAELVAGRTDAALEAILVNGGWTDEEARLARAHATALRYGYDARGWAFWLGAIRAIAAGEATQENGVRPTASATPRAPTKSSLRGVAGTVTEVEKDMDAGRKREKTEPAVEKLEG